MLKDYIDARKKLKGSKLPRSVPTPVTQAVQLAESVNWKKSWKGIQDGLESWLCHSSRGYHSSAIARLF
jgi:hypothetical protein